MIMKLALNSKSSAALREFAQVMPLAMQNIVEETNKVFQVYQSVSETLGEHDQDFRDMLKSIQKAQEEAADAILALPPEMNRTADKIDAYIKKPASIPSNNSHQRLDGSTETISSGIAMNKDNHTMHDDLNDSELFKKNPKGIYQYRDDGKVKTAFGQLTLAKDVVRDAKAQRTVGGENRQYNDHGGHLIAAIFGGAPDYKNLDAQNKDINCRAYRSQERVWQKLLKEHCKVFVKVQTVKDNQSGRPNVYMAYAIYEYPDGTREWDAFSITNYSESEQLEWQETLDKEDFL